MKKYFTLLFISFLATAQAINAQLDLVFISNFSSSSNNSVNRLTWTTGKNHGISSFDLERSTNGIDFKTVGVIKATEKFNTENYTYSDTLTSRDIIMYRLRIVSKNQFISFSKILIIKSNTSSNQDIQIIGNPVKDQLSFNYNSKNAQQSNITVYNLRGNIVLSQKVDSFTGNNLVTIPLNSLLAPGLYVVEINNGILIQTAKFIKQ